MENGSDLYYNEFTLRRVHFFRRFIEMAVIDELIREEADGGLSFGNYALETKTKKDGFMYMGDSYKVKTFNEITKLEKNGSFVYESVPGTTVHEFFASAEKITFSIEGNQDAQITLELEPEQEYKIYKDEVYSGKVKTNLGGKLILSASLEDNAKSDFVIEKAVD